ncbi:hypothetical protein J1605_006218 [Eschrichtius robustus]|uniref:Peptidase M12B domain-containing protein n=1 Tax=Eschrichtius robustus TaxID=9764 RepID=A0AB34H0Z8_ESCRO|nr:hypothetical protein J1605_006218 [Eschrichtius robustus]
MLMKKPYYNDVVTGNSLNMWEQHFLAQYAIKAVMLVSLWVSSGIKIFSNCSMRDYRYFVSTFEGQCLQNFSKLKPLYQNQSVCGNGILEPQEECDCDSEQPMHLEPVLHNKRSHRNEKPTHCNEE